MQVGECIYYYIIGIAITMCIYNGTDNKISTQSRLSVILFFYCDSLILPRTFNQQL